MNFIEKLFHKHNDVTEHRIKYCMDCGSPFTSIYAAQKCVAGYKKTEEKNKVLGKQPLRSNNIKSVVRRGSSEITRCEKANGERCLIIECQGKIRCLHCGHEPVKSFQGNVLSINDPRIKKLFEDWRYEAVRVGILND